MYGFFRYHFVHNPLQRLHVYSPAHSPLFSSSERRNMKGEMEWSLGQEQRAEQERHAAATDGKKQTEARGHQVRTWRSGPWETWWNS